MCAHIEWMMWNAYQRSSTLLDIQHLLTSYYFVQLVWAPLTPNYPHYYFYDITKWPTAISKVGYYTSLDWYAYLDESSGRRQYYKITVDHTNSPPTWTVPPTLLRQNSAVLLVGDLWCSPESMWMRVTQLQLQFQKLGALGSCGVACCFTFGNYQVNYLHQIISSQQQWSGRFLGITGWDPECLQVQPVTCWHPPVLLY